MIDAARYAAQGVLTGLSVIPEAHARRIGHHLRASPDRTPALIRALARHDGVLSHVGAVLGADLMVRNADVFVKMPGCEGRIDWHLDSAKPWPAVGGMVNLWLALSHSGPDSGAVSYLPGVHHRPLTGGPTDKESLTLSPAARASLPLSEAITPNLRPGQGTLHAFSTPHRSGGNTTDQPRIGLVLRFIAAGIDKTNFLVRRLVAIVDQVAHALGNGCGPTGWAESGELSGQPIGDRLKAPLSGFLCALGGKAPHLADLIVRGGDGFLEGGEGGHLLAIELNAPGFASRTLLDDEELGELSALLEEVEREPGAAQRPPRVVGDGDDVGVDVHGEWIEVLGALADVGERYLPGFQLKARVVKRQSAEEGHRLAELHAIEVEVSGQTHQGGQGDQAHRRDIDKVEDEAVGLAGMEAGAAAGALAVQAR